MRLNPMKTMQNFTHLNSRVPRHASRDREISDFLRNSLALFSTIAKNLFGWGKKKSIQEFGNNDPIAMDENAVIIEGHGRYEALKQFGFDEIEIIRLSHLNEQQKKSLHFGTQQADDEHGI